MQAGCIVLVLIFPIFLDGCCRRNYQKKGTESISCLNAHRRYKVVEGEIFQMPCKTCVHNRSAWSRTGEGREADDLPFSDCRGMFQAKEKHSGNYTCLACGGGLSLHLQVVEKNRLSCLHPEESSTDLVIAKGGKVRCPGLNCSDNTHVIWFKGYMAMSEQRRDSCEENGWLHLCQVKEHDTGVYFCDRRVTEQGVNWTYRRAVNVTVIPFDKPSYPPGIVYPDGNTTEEVELGQSHTLECKVNFPVERFPPEVRWYMHYGGNMENMTPLIMERQQQQEKVIFTEVPVIQRAVIKEVIPQHLNNTYTCIARNTVGNSSVTIKLKERTKVKWPCLVGYPIASLLLVAGLGIILHVKWLEVQLIYRCHFQRGKHNGDEKEFDVFLSYVWSPTSVQELSSPSGPDADEEACFRLNSEESNTTERPPEVLLPQVLEDQWGYRLCLLERDVLPGGAYTNDVIRAIQRSQILICLLSADYLSNSNAVFVLESGVQALLQNSTLKLLLIRTNRASLSLVQPDPPLPTLVQRALTVLPSLDWTSGAPARATSSFWKSLRKAMPEHRTKMGSLRIND